MLSNTDMGTDILQDGITGKKKPDKKSQAFSLFGAIYYKTLQL